MIEISTWMNTFLKALNETFGDRVWFVGLQGSYGRGEATESSDIDVGVILDELSTPGYSNLRGLKRGEKNLYHCETPILSIGETIA